MIIRTLPWLRIGADVTDMEQPATIIKRMLAGSLVLLGSICFPGVVHAASGAMKQNSDVKICYIAFYLNTFVPLTKANIARHANCYSMPSRSGAAVALIGLLNDAQSASGASEKFNDDIVRVMLFESSSEGAYFVDKNGVVSRGKSTSRLPAWQKAAVQVILNASYRESKSKERQK